MLAGGLPRGRMTLVRGGPGSGKSIMGLQCLLHGAFAGAPGILVMFEERAAAMRQNAWSRGWDLASLEKANKLCLLDARVDPEAVVSGDFSIKGLLAVLAHKIKAMRARCVVLDAVDVLLQMYDSPARERKELYALHEWLLAQGVTAIMTAKAVAGEEASFPLLRSWSSWPIVSSSSTSASWVRSPRGACEWRSIAARGYGRNEYPFIINEDGINVVAITSNALHHRPLGPKVSSGQQELDGLLAGGYSRGASVLIADLRARGRRHSPARSPRPLADAASEPSISISRSLLESMVCNMLSPGLALRR